jgi:hypothetical protein
MIYVEIEGSKFISAILARVHGQLFRLVSGWFILHCVHGRFIVACQNADLYHEPATFVVMAMTSVASSDHVSFQWLFPLWPIHNIHVYSTAMLKQSIAWLWYCSMCVSSSWWHERTMDSPILSHKSCCVSKMCQKEALMICDVSSEPFIFLQNTRGSENHTWILWTVWDKVAIRGQVEWSNSPWRTFPIGSKPKGKV